MCMYIYICYLSIHIFSWVPSDPSVRLTRFPEELQNICLWGYPRAPCLGIRSMWVDWQVYHSCWLAWCESSKTGLSELYRHIDFVWLSLAWDTGQIQSFWLPIVQHQSLGLSIEQALALVHLHYEHGAVSSLQHPRVVRMAAVILCPVNQSSLASRVVTHPFWKPHSTCLSALLGWLLLSLPGTLRQLLYNVIRSFLHISSFASNCSNVVLSLVGLKLCQGRAVTPCMNMMAHPTPSMAPLIGGNE